ncbi:MAG: carbohydrate ABC transporter permease [Bacillota bacterium]|nr:carbohydrate ABC transporter permease [Bacillota bacterium]
MSYSLRHRKSSRAYYKMFDIINTCLMLIIAFITLYPFWYCLILSFNDGIDALKGPLYFLPRKISLENYEFVLNSPYILTALRNSVLRAVLGSVLSCAFTGLVAYGLSKREIFGRKAYMIYFTITMYFSGGMIPSYLLIKNLGLLDNFLVYIIPTMFGIFNAILFIAYYDSIPKELEESAFIDGAGVINIFFRIIFPTSLPIFATIALFTIVSQWNSYFDTLIYTSSDSLVTMQAVMSRMIAMAEAANEMNSKLAAGSTAVYAISPVTVRVATLIVTAFPITVVYPFLQKYFVKGIMLGAVKG